MLIEQLSDFSVKYTISQNELEEFGVDFDSISRYDANTRLMVSHLMILAESRDDISIQFGDSEVYVEAFSCHNGNCIVYVSLIEPHRSHSHKYIERSNFLACSTCNLNHLIRISKQLIKFARDAITSSRLYLSGDRLLLLLEFDRRAFETVLYTLAEFCDYSTERPNYQQLSEYYHCLANGDALYRLSILTT